MNNPTEIVLKEYTLPHVPHKYQEDMVEDAVNKYCCVLTAGVGYGKSLVSLTIALHHSIISDVEQILVIVPPVLIPQTEELFKSVPEIPDVCVYQGTPKERAAMDLNDSVIIMSNAIFRRKKDFARVQKMARERKLCILVDEISIKSLKSQTYRKLKLLTYGKMRVGLADNPLHILIGMNATLISDLSQIYNALALFRPGVYQSKRQFWGIHCAAEDQWGTCTKWDNTDLMADNLRLLEVDAPEGVIDLPPIIYTKVDYSLKPKHRKLYNDIKTAKFDNLDYSLPPAALEKMVDAMFSTLQRLTILPDEYGLDIRPPIFDWLDSYLDQIGSEQFIIYTRHIAVTERILEYLGDKVVGVYGRVNPKKKKEALARLESFDVQGCVGNMDSLGVGLNLFFLQRAIFLEIPFREDKWTQCVGRVYRQGQLKTSFFHIPIAKGTVQRRIYRKLLNNSDDLSKIYRNKEKLRDFIED